MSKSKLGRTETTDILKLLPHRYPFLLVDRIVEMERRPLRHRHQDRLGERALLSGTLSAQSGHAGHAPS